MVTFLHFLCIVFLLLGANFSISFGPFGSFFDLNLLLFDRIMLS
jgi:hypothetical protein